MQYLPCDKACNPVVIYSEADGIFLGECLGLEFWSKLDPCDQPAAVTFQSPIDAERYMSTWRGGRRMGVLLVPVEADQDGYASVEACVKAGLPSWIVTDTETANVLPC